jgi:hypothetical protein
MLLGLTALALVTETPSLVEARPGRGGWYGGGRRGYYRGQWWGRSYGYPRWGWGNYYSYPGYYYPYPAYGYPGYRDSYTFDDVSAPPTSETTTSLYNNPAPSPEEKAASEMLTASGVSNDNGRLRWPVGLKDLGGPEGANQADELRGQLNALFQQAIEQKTKGSANSKLLQEISHAVKRFRSLLTRDREERGQLPEAVYDEADNFLNQLDHAVAALRSGQKTPGGESR